MKIELKHASLCAAVIFAAIFASGGGGIAPAGADSPQQGPDLDRALIAIDSRTINTDAVYQQVLNGLRLLPFQLKRAFQREGINIVITSSRSKYDGGPEGQSCFEPKFKRVVIVELDASTPLKLRRLPITTLHEIGHAYDFMQGYISKRPDFLRQYNQEARRVDAGSAGRLSYFLQGGHRGPSECFASLFARKYYAGPDRRLQELESAFPKTFNLVRDWQP